MNADDMREGRNYADDIARDAARLLLFATEDGITWYYGYSEVDGRLIATRYDDDGEPAGTYVVTVSAEEER